MPPAEAPLQAAAISAWPRWRDIASAPKDGTPVLIFHPDGSEPRIALADWRIDGWFDTWSESGGAIDAEATHWLPLPTPPSEDGRRRGCGQPAPSRSPR